MKRPLALFERAMYLDGRMPVNAMVTACIRGRLTEDRIRQALALVQAKHSILHCLIVDENSRPWFVLQEPAPPIPLRIIERQGDDDWVEASMHESLQRFDGSCEPLARLTWLRGEAKSELLLVCQHAICDGRSLLTLLGEILRLCDEPDSDIGSPTSLNAIEEIFPAKVLADRGLQRRIRWKVGVLKLLLRFARSRPAFTYGKVYRSFWTLDEPSAQLLIERCKAEGVTVFAVIAVAFMLAFCAVCGAKGIEKFVAPVDIRRFLPDLRSDSLFAIAPTVPLSLGKPRDTVSSAADFWRLARALKADMARRIDRLGSTVYTYFLGMEHLHDVYDRMAVYAQSKRAGRRVSLSYLGRLELDRDYRDFRLQAVCGISAMLAPTPANLIVISSFAGRFDFSFASDESSLPYAQAMQVKDKAMAALLACAMPAEPESTPTGVARAETS